jgi:hypothetical protein
MMRVFLSGVLMMVFVTIGVLGCAVVVGPPHGRVVVAPPPPVVVIPTRPRLVFIPEYRIYVAIDVDHDLFYDGSVWFYFHDGLWYRGGEYNGPWVVVKKGLPPGLVQVPPGQLKKRAFKIKEQESEGHDNGKKGRGRRFED